MKAALGRLTDLLLVLLVTLGAVAVQGYHLGVDDAEIYQPAIKRVIDPSLYPSRAEFFLSHARLGHLSLLVGKSARLFHLSPDTAILLWHIAGVLLIVFAGWRLARTLFTTRRAVWGAVLTLALTLSVPVAGTALVIADPYLTARSFSTPLSLLAIDAFLRGKRVGTLFYLAATGFFHPQMVAYTAALLLIFALPTLRFPGFSAARAAAVPGLFKSFSLQPAAGPYRELLYSRTFFFASMWRWWEFVGIVVPLLLLQACARAPLRGLTPACRQLLRASVVFGWVSTAFWLLFATSRRFDSFERLQPMRSLDLIYIFMFLLLGALAAEYLLRARPLRWAALFVPLAGGMCALNGALYPASPHVELPGHAGGNAWLEAFFWVRADTPKDALFALDPSYLVLPGEDQHGFRAVAERSRLADFYKDCCVATMFPELTGAWVRDLQALHGWRSFTAPDFERLYRTTGVDWVVLERHVAGLDCPYAGSGVWVCRIGNGPETGKTPRSRGAQKPGMGVAGLE